MLAVKARTNIVALFDLVPAVGPALSGPEAVLPGGPAQVGST